MKFTVLAQVLILGFLTQSSLSTVKIWTPGWLANYYKKRTIQSSIANFGKVPYGHNIIGRIEIASPKDACKPITVDQQIGEEKSPLIVLAERGNCRFIDKALFAQQVGAVAIIVVDNRDENVRKVLPFAKAQDSIIVNIPTLLIGQEEGKGLIRAAISHASALSEIKEEIVVSLGFPLRKQQKAKVQFKFDINSFQSLENFLEVAYNFLKFGEKIHFQPIYRFFFLQEKKTSVEPFNCLDFEEGSVCTKSAAGRYQPVLKKSKLYISLKHLFLYNKLSLKQWINYMAEFRDNCYDDKNLLRLDLEECTTKASKKAQIENYVKRFNKELDEGLNENTLLHKLVTMNHNIEEKFLPVTPSVRINNQILMGTTGAFQLIENVCDSIIIPPIICKTIKKNNLGEIVVKNRRGFLFYMKVLLFSLLTGLISTVVFYIVYKLKLRKELKDRAQNEVDNALSKYYQERKDTSELK